MIDKATVKRILDAADIVEVVGDYVNLVKRGSNFMGLCPFHNEKTASFSVNRQRNICHCFSCGKGGSPVNFIMEKEGINFHDALIHLANKYGIKVEERELSDEERQEQSERESMLIVNDWAMREMEYNLNDTQEGREVALEYFRHRGITNDAIKKFHLGYALDDGQSLSRKATASGYDVNVLKSVGLCGENSQGKIYDRFRGRVIFPVLNSAGKVIAFGGRGIKGEAAKYINSPESLVYKKSNELYGIYQAKNAIVRQDKCYLVEGYMDVIGMWQSGMENTVASSGTSLTDGQIALIHRFTKNVTLIYDGDAAGIKASLRGIDLLLTHNLNIKVLLLPDGDDPDSFSQKHTPEEFRKYIGENETDFIKFKTKILFENSGNDAIARTEAVRSIVASLASIGDNVKRTFYIQECSRQLNISEQILIAEVKKKRVDVVAEQRKQRIAGIDNVKSTSDSIVSIDNDKKLSENAQSNNLLYPLEKEIIRYCIKYGMIDFCESADTEGNIKTLKVIEYVDDEMKFDNIRFSVNIYDSIFRCIINMIPEFDIALVSQIKIIEEKIKDYLAEGYNEISQKDYSVQEIETAEKKLSEKAQELKDEEIINFTQLFICKELGNHPQNDIRKISLDLITERYQLSKYHAKNTKIESELEKLSELLPRAISEWKDGILAVKFKKIQDDIKNATISGETEKIRMLMEQLQEISKMRCEFAKHIGERIISPK